MRGLAAAVLAGPLFAHVVSLSTGEAALTGRRLDYELRMPLYEAAHMEQPERDLFENLHFSSGGERARLVERGCRAQDGNLECRGAYLFPKPVDVIEVECTFAYVTVPNHIHMLRARRGSRVEQVTLDASSTKAEIRFRDLTSAERAERAASSGFLAGLRGVAHLLFLLALAAAVPERRRFVASVLCFLAGEAAGRLLGPHAPWPLSPRFIEAASALTVAYLALEALMVPNAGGRWIIAGLCGGIHGLSFPALSDGGWIAAISFLAGVFAAQGGFAVVLTWLARVLRPGRAFGGLQAARALASLLAIIGLGWFLLRLKS
ncbi:MAG TPA: HupE/UreJ family protein [Bryobacteraceae bacterium]|jgi:hypothetical protein|nr:HupE/UreJ family protein [Bryobacteraceae bacterium]